MKRLLSLPCECLSYIPHNSTNVTNQLWSLMNRLPRHSLEAQLDEIQSRLNPRYVEGCVRALDLRVRDLRRALESIHDDQNELYRYFPVAALATLESYFKTAVAAIIDHSSEYLERGLALIAERSLKAHEAIGIIRSGTATPGQLIAHLLPFSSLAHLENSIDKLLDASIKEQLRTALDAYDVRNEQNEPRVVVTDVPDLWRRLDQAFRHRHILAHEAAPDFRLTRNEVCEVIDAVDEFMHGANAVLWNSVWRATPLTMREINDRAGKEMFQCRQRLSSLIRKLKRLGRLDIHRHRLWRTYFLGYMNGVGDEMMGSIRPRVYATTATSLLHHRIRELEPRFEEGALF